MSNKVVFAFSERDDGSMSPASGEREAILSNRKEFLKRHHLADYPLILMNQVHGERIHLVDDYAKIKQTEHLEGDAIITSSPNIVIGIMTADCLPIIIFDKEGRGVGAIHAGRKGSELMIAGKAVLKFADIFNIDKKDVVAIIGAGIGDCCYEVEEELVVPFRKEGIYQADDIVTTKVNGRLMLDLVQVNKIQLLDAGLSASNIFLSDKCTCCDGDFFSYRGGDRLERMMSVVALSPQK
ncbi:MAG: peptidoglycan editing factor PgeF [Nitrospinota bacterium]|nr:peptidoglycan editing factor PgeF [Nitrospinota bacterium]